MVAVAFVSRFVSRAYREIVVAIVVAVSHTRTVFNVRFVDAIIFND